MKSSLDTRIDIQRITKKKTRKKQMVLLLMFLPMAGLLLVINYVPMYGIIVSFMDYNPYLGIFHSPWVGLKYFKSFLLDLKFWEVIKNTLIMNFIDIGIGFSIPIIFALLVNEMLAVRFKKILQTISYMPHFISWVVVGGMVTTILAPDQNGIVNMVLIKVFHMKPIFFMAESSYFRPIAFLAQVWKDTGFSAIVYFAALAGIDTALYEAGLIDGAGRLKLAIHISLPSLLPMMSLMMIFSIANLFTIGFDRMFLLQNTMNLDVSDVISTYIYNLGITEMQYSRTAAIGFVQSLLSFGLLYGANHLSHKVSGIGLY